LQDTNFSHRIQAAMIPKLLHFCFGLSPEFHSPEFRDKPWSLAHHVCVRSAVERIKPERAFFYYELMPSGPWWALTRKLVTLVKVTAPREIFGKPVKHPSHRADVLRLQKLIEHGGIYLDIDVLVHRSFDDLLQHETVLGLDVSRVGADRLLCNAIILAQQNAPFLRAWYDEYRSFRSNGSDQFWDEHSCQVPARLAREMPQLLTILEPRHSTGRAGAATTSI
jgi:hypothetical protein